MRRAGFAGRGARQVIARNVEIKARVSDLAALEAKVDASTNDGPTLIGTCCCALRRVARTGRRP
jgi:hypothetical protein